MRRLIRMRGVPHTLSVLFPLGGCVFALSAPLMAQPRPGPGAIVPAGQPVAPGRGERRAGVERLTVRAYPQGGAHYAVKDATLGPLGRRDILDTPFSVMTVPHDAIVNQQARNANDLIGYLPSAQLEMRGDPNTSRPQSRGFEADVIANSRIDGLNMVITTPYPAEMFDSLQVLNGLSGALYGPQNPAGTFDYRLRRPDTHRQERLVVGVDSSGAPLESLDATGRQGGLGYRVTMLNQSGHTVVPGARLRRALISGAFDIALTRRTTLQIDASQYSYAQKGYPGAFSFGPGLHLPGPPDLSVRGYGQPYAEFSMSTDTVLAKLVHRFDESWSLTLGGLYQNAARNVFSVTNILTDDSGDYRASIAAATTADVFRVWSDLAYLRGRIRTGRFRHRLVLGSTGYTLDTFNPVSGQSAVLGMARIGAPRVFEGTQPYHSGQYQSAAYGTHALLAGDTVALTRRWSLMGMVAWSWIDTTSRARTGEITADHASGPTFTPTVSLLYRPTAQASLYATWGQGIQAGPVAPASSRNANVVLGPLRSEMYEIGAKYRFGSGLTLGIAGFRMSRTFAFTDPVTSLFREAGKQRNYGVELQGTGALLPELSVFGGLTWLDAQIGETGSALTAHKQVVGVAPLQASALIDYHPRWFPHGAMTAHLHYVGRRAADLRNASFADGFVTLDLGLRYGVSLGTFPVTLRFGATNVTDARYWASVYPSSVNGSVSASGSAVAGLPRSYHATAEIAF